MGVNQCEEILSYIETNGGITPKEAENWLGCMRLAARINDLRKKGYNIRTEMKTTDKGARYALYKLEK